MLEGGGFAKRILGAAVVAFGGGRVAVADEPLHAGEVGADREGAGNEPPSKVVRCRVCVACLSETPAEAVHEAQRGGRGHSLVTGGGAHGLPRRAAVPWVWRPRAVLAGVAWEKPQAHAP